MNMWQDVASPRSRARGSDRSRAGKRRGRDLPPHPLRSRLLEARRYAVRRLARRAALVVATLGALALAVWGGYHLRSRLPVFQVDHIEVAGNGSLARDEVLALAGLAGPVSVWENLTEITARLEGHPLVASARVTRELPSTLLVEIEEKTPVGLVASPVVVPVDRGGAVLPLDPTEPFLDLPVLRVVTRSATPSCGVCALAADVDMVADETPEMFAILSEARLYDREAVLLLGDAGLRVRYRTPVSRRRLRDAVIAIGDASERIAGGELREIDLRFEDQVIVRPAASPAEEGGGGG